MTNPEIVNDTIRETARQKGWTVYTRNPEAGNFAQYTFYLKELDDAAATRVVWSTEIILNEEIDFLLFEARSGYQHRFYAKAPLTPETDYGQIFLEAESALFKHLEEINEQRKNISNLFNWFNFHHPENLKDE